MPKDKQLFEAAAEILSQSKANATAMPPESLGGVQDLGGPTPFNGNPTDDSEKIDTSKGSVDYSQKNKKEHDMKPSAAAAQVVSKLANEDFSEEIGAIFEGGSISEDFKTKAATIFEARLFEKVSAIEEALESKYATMLDEAVEDIQVKLAEKVDEYLSYVVEQWVEDNKIALEAGVKTEITEDFIAGLKNLFTEHYIDIPEDQVNVVDELTEKIVTLEDRLNEEIDKNVQIKKDLVESKKIEVIHIVSEGLTDTQEAKLKTLAESVEFTTEDEYKQKLEIIKENYFTTTVKKPSMDDMNEQIPSENTVYVDPVVAMVSKSIAQNYK